jgi:hypothetical protein
MKYFVMYVVRVYDDEWSHVVAEFETEQEANDEADRLEEDSAWTDTYFKVVEEN